MYIVTAIRRNPGKQDYIMTAQYANGRTLTFGTPEDAQAEADRLQADPAAQIYGAKVIHIPTVLE